MSTQIHAPLKMCVCVIKQFCICATYKFFLNFAIYEVAHETLQKNIQK